MTSSDVARLRMLTQRVAGTRFERAADVVRWLGAVQAQDYLGALWAVALRTRGATGADVERAIAERAIVRTWPMRGTLHLVAAEDARWMLALLAPRVVASRARRYRELALDDAAFRKSRDAVARALQGGRRLSRGGLYGVLDRAGVSPGGQRGIHVLSQLALEGLVCFASREGKQQTFALVEEWLPPARAMAREEALAELATRYFTGHGPASLQDFAWWSGLSAGEAREALELARPKLVHDAGAGREVWRSASTPPRARVLPGAVLLPPFDELLVGYRDRSAILDPAHTDAIHALLSPTIVLGDRVVGTWTRKLGNGAVIVTPTWFERRRRIGATALAKAAERYGRFLETRVVVA